MPGYFRRSVLGVAGAVLISKGLGFLREMAIADKFGTSADYDLYLIGIMLPSIFYGILNYAGFYFLVPYFTKALNARDSGESNRRMRSIWAVINLNLTASVVTTVMIIIVAPYVLKFWTAGFSEQDFSRVVFFSRIMAVMAVLGTVEAVFRAFLNVKGIFTYSAASYILFNLISISGILLFQSRYSVLSIAIGVIGGLVIQNLYLLLRVLGFRPLANFRASLYNDEIRAVMTGAVVLLLVELVNRSYFMIDWYFAADLGEGIISAINYSYVLVRLPDAVVGFAIGAVIFPKFSVSAADPDDRHFVSLYRKATMTSVMLAVPLAVLFYVGAPDIILLAFHRGSFDIGSVITTAAALRTFTPSIVALFVISISIRACYSRDWGKFVLAYAMIFFVVKLAGTAVLSKMIGYAGIPAATSMAHVGFASLMLFRLVHKTKGEAKLLFLLSLGKLILAGLMALFAATYAVADFEPAADSYTSAALRLGLASIIICIVYIFSAMLLGMKQQLVDLRRQIIGRS